MRLAHVGEEVWVGDYEACDQKGELFDLRLHLYRQCNVDEKRCCAQVSSPAPNGMKVHWREGEPIDALSAPFSMLVEYFQSPGRLLIHCAAGVCRSPILAVAAKISRGCDPWKAISEVQKGIWTSYAEPIWLTPESMRGILTWALDFSKNRD